MEFEPKHILLLVLAVAFIFKRIYSNHTFVQKYNPLISLTIILALVALIGIEFWSESRLFSIIAIFLGVASAVKVALDMAKK